jgi:FAD-dependent urate hydroxylase
VRAQLDGVNARKRPLEATDRRTSAVDEDRCCGAADPSRIIEPRPLAVPVEHTPLLVLGAGPYGLATAALARHRGLETMVVGQPMGFWRENMPRGMLLRSGIDWHLDPLGVHTLRAYLEERGIDEADVHPIPVELFVEYADWYAGEAGVDVVRTTVTALHRRDAEGFVAHFDDGSSVAAANVVATPGVRYFASIPVEVQESLPPERYEHTCTATRFDRLEGSRVLIVGGRQSAFEWAALIAEQMHADVDLVYRHDSPSFTPSDWSFVDALLEQTVRFPGWFRRLPRAEQDAVSARFWAEGRLKLEPWLERRTDRPTIRRWPNHHVQSYAERPTGDVEVVLSGGRRLVVDHVVLATGYRTDMTKVPYLSASRLVDELALRNGFPILDEDFQASVPGLFFPSWPSTQDFGPFFGFVAGVPAATRIVVDTLVEAA